MKQTHLIAIMAAALVLQSCFFPITKDQKAKHAIKNYLNEHLKDPKSYEEISFSVIDTAFKMPFADKEYKNVYNDLEKITIKMGRDITDLDFPQLYNTKKLRAEIRRLRPDSIRLSIKLDAMSDSIRHIPFGWRISHKYRSRNGFGGMVISENTFYLNNDLSSITDVF